MKTNVDFPITVQAKEVMNGAMDKQDKYGYPKYGKALDHRDNYDWNSMAIEEFADGIKYMICEYNRKQDVIKLLENALNNTGESEIYVLAALEILRMEGTGK